MGILVYRGPSRFPFSPALSFPVGLRPRPLAYLNHTLDIRSLAYGFGSGGPAPGSQPDQRLLRLLRQRSLNRIFTPFSGGSRVIQNQEMSPESVKAPGLPAVGPGGGVRPQPDLTWDSWWPWRSCWVWGAALFYSASPLQLHERRPWGKSSFSLPSGAAPLLGAYYVQTGNSAWRGLPSSLPLAFLITAIIWINEFPDLEADLAAGKRHLVSRLGLQVSALVYAP